MHVSKRLLVILAVVLAFAAGFGLASELARAGSTASARGQAALYRQVLNDLERNYYRPIDVAKLGQSGINGLLAPLHDPYTVYFTPQQAKAFGALLSGTYTGIGTGVDTKAGRLTVTKVFPGSPAAQAGIRSGDAIITVDGVPTAGKSVDANVARIVGAAGTQVRLQLRRAGVAGLIDLSLTRRRISPPLTSSRLLNDHGTKVGYVSLSSLRPGRRRAGRAGASPGCRSRARSGSSSTCATTAAGWSTRPPGWPATFCRPARSWSPRRACTRPRTSCGRWAAHPTSLPLVVLVNGNTASASEIVTGALQDYRRATIIGTRTFGKGVVQTVLPLSGGASLKITIASYLTPLGRNINHKGIEPNIVVKQSPKSKVDQALQRVLRFIAVGR